MKRLFDIALSAALLLILSPLLLAVAFALRVTIGAPVFFVQVRPGRHGKTFRMYKFRTMNDRRDQAGALLSDQERTTRLGSFLRRSSLDELPELWNVLRGEMSLVGPRPLLVAYLPHYTSEQRRRHELRPGITGWAQVNGRNSVTWEEKLALDVWYVDRQNLGLDLCILWLTLRAVFSGRGTAANRACLPSALHGATMDELLAPSHSRSPLSSDCNL